MKNKNENFIRKIMTNPIFFLLLIIIVFAGLIYFVGPKNNSTNNGNMVSSYEIRDNVVTITEYGDYQCPACGIIYPKIEEILSIYGDKIKLDYRHYPLPFHNYALKASIASECARDQNKFWQMHKKLYENQKNLEIDDLKKYAVELELNSEDFNNCLNNNKHLDKINKDKSNGNLDGINGTPTFFINGKKLINSENEKFIPSINDFKREIDAELIK